VTALDLDGMLRRLHLPTVRRLYPECERRAEADDQSYRDFLAILIAEEVAHRAQTRIERSVRKARFPFLRTIEDFDFTFQSSIRLQLLGSYLGPELVSEGRSLILCGPTGTGKTHLAIAIAYRAIQNGYEALFTSAAEMIETLAVATRRGELAKTLATYTHPPVLVIDEVGYLAVGGDAANLMFQVVNDRYLHRRPMLFTTNKPLAAWGLVLHDPDLAEAILDRVLERGRLVELRGASYRTRHLKRADPDRSPLREGATISGNQGPDFPEPTASLQRSLRCGTPPGATLLALVRPDERSPDRSRYTEPAGVSPARTRIGPSGSRPPARGEIAVAEAGRRKPLRREQERGPQHQVKPAASTEEQCGSRAEHVAAKAMFAVRKSEAAAIASPAGVEGAARAQGSVWNRRDPSARPVSGQSGAYKPKAKSRRAQRESEGVVVPARVVTNNATGGKRPCFGHARRKGKCEGMDGKTVPNHPHVRKHVVTAREPGHELWAGAKRLPPTCGGSIHPTRRDARIGEQALEGRGVVHAPSGRPSVSRVLEIGTHGLSGGLTASRLFSGVT
jgi:DNA replication protein DnaC